MLNRVFIAVGLLTILALIAAFVAPRFIPWGNYRAGMELAASQAIGAPVKLDGDIGFELLPQPKLRLKQVTVGPPDAPLLLVEEAEAELSLPDFLRDRYSITKLTLQGPEVRLAIDANGDLTTPVALGQGPSDGKVSIEDAIITAGRVVVADARSTNGIRIDGIGGELSLPAQGAPLSFQGSGILNGGVYDFRLSSTGSNEQGRSGVALFVGRADNSFTVAAEGELTLGTQPRFVGDLTLRGRAPPARTDLVRGDLVITSSVEADLDRLLLPAYTIVPDENRAGTRLTGAASMTLGPDAAFDAIISGGVLSLPPRDATAEDAIVPYEVVRLLAELPAPPMIPVPGRIGVDIAEVSLRVLPLRNVRFDAATGPQGWSISNFSALLPGNSVVQLEGTLGAESGRPRFTGRVALESARLDALAQLWRRPDASNPLFNLKGAFTANAALDEDTLSLTGGNLTLNDEEHALSIEVGFGETRRVDVTADLGALDEDESAAIAALLPEFSASSAFGVTFPRGSLSVEADSATLLGLQGAGLAAQGTWEGGVFDLKTLSAEELGGTQFNLALTVFGTMARPELFGGGSIRVASGSAPLVQRLFDTLETPSAIRDTLTRSVPAELAVQLDPPAGDGSQGLVVDGQAGVAQLSAQAQLSGGLLRALGAPLGVKLDVISPDVAGLSAQLGFVDGELLSPDGPMHLAVTLQSVRAGGYEASATLQSGLDSIGFAGNVIASDPARWTGTGVLKANLSDPGPLLAELGVGGIAVPPFSGSAELEFAGSSNIRLTDIQAVSGGQPVTGRLLLVGQGEDASVSGGLTLGEVPLEALAAALLGPAGMISSGSGIWPDGPISAGDQPRRTTGRIEINSPAITRGGAPLIQNVGFDVAWDETTLRIADLSGTMGAGTLGFDASICCAATAAEKTLNARIELDGIPVTHVLPLGERTGLSGTLSGGAQVQGTGETLAAAVSSLAGDGSFAIRDFAVQGLAPTAFSQVADLTDVTETPPETLEAQIRSALEQGTFEAPEVAGSFSIAGGVLRSANLAVQGNQLRLFGGGMLSLEDLSLSGSYAITPVGALGTDGFINETTAQVTAILEGTLLEPTRTFDVNALVDALQVHAYEVELAELEQLRAQDEARMRAARDLRNMADTTASVEAAMAVVLSSHELVEGAAERAGAAAVRAAEFTLAATRPSTPSAQQSAPGRPALPQVNAAPAGPIGTPLVLTPTEPGSRF